MARQRTGTQPSAFHRSRSSRSSRMSIHPTVPFILPTLLMLFLISLLTQTSTASQFTLGDTIPDGPFTVSAKWSWQANTPDQFTLIGIAPQSTPNAPLISIQMTKDTSGWFPTWKLQLHMASATNDADRIINLMRGNFSAGQNITATLSYHPDAKILAVALYDEASSIPLVAEGMQIPAVRGPFVPLASKVIQAPEALESDAPRLEKLVAVARYQPVADQYEIGELQPDGVFVPVTSLSSDQQASIRITTPIAAPGEYVLTLPMPNSSNKSAAPPMELARFSPNQTQHWVKLPLEQLPAGPSDLLIEYRDKGVTTFSQILRLTLGKAKFDVQYTGVDRQHNTINGVLHTSSADRLDGVNVKLQAQYTMLTWDAKTHSFREATPTEAQTILELPAQELVAGSPQEFTAPLPEVAGAWRVNLSAVTEPKIASNVTGAQELVTNYSTAPDYPIAGTNQANSHIVIYDPNVKDWSKPEAIMWSWMPTPARGFSIADISRWGGPSDVKLRNNDIWGGQWLVATAGDMAVIAAYPSGMKKWAGNVGRGSNPHAAELLPNGNIAVAASTGGWVRVYTSSQGPTSTTYTEFTLPGAHGVLWDPSLEVLWAVGDYELVALKVTGAANQPVIEQVFVKKLPTNWGHDLYPVYGDADRLWVTTGSHVYQYVKSTGTWLDTFLGSNLVDRAGVKSIGNQPSGQIVLTHPREGSLYTWSTDTVKMFVPGAVQVVPNAAFYKVRIWSPEYQ